MLRHSGPSHDRARGLRTLQETAAGTVALRLERAQVPEGRPPGRAAAEAAERRPRASSRLDRIPLVGPREAFALTLASRGARLVQPQ
eukprot:8136541-Pyramimonas_sp.AAC.1